MRATICKAYITPACVYMCDVEKEMRRRGGCGVALFISLSLSVHGICTYTYSDEQAYLGQKSMFSGRRAGRLEFGFFFFVCKERGAVVGWEGRSEHDK